MMRRPRDKLKLAFLGPLVRSLDNCLCMCEDDTMFTLRLSWCDSC